MKETRYTASTLLSELPLVAVNKILQGAEKHKLATSNTSCSYPGKQK